MTNKQIKRCLASLVIRETQVTTTTKYIFLALDWQQQRNITIASDEENTMRGIPSTLLEKFSLGENNLVFSYKGDLFLFQSFTLVQVYTLET